LKNGDKIVAAS